MKNVLFRIIVCLMCSFLCVPSLYSQESNAKNNTTIVIDPAHGGIDSGSLYGDGYSEKDLMLELAKDISHRLNDKFKTVLTRSKDITVDISSRVEVVNSIEEALYIGLHLGSVKDKKRDSSKILYNRFIQKDILDQTIKDFKNSVGYENLYAEEGELLIYTELKCPAITIQLGNMYDGKGILLRDKDVFERIAESTTEFINQLYVLIGS